MKILIIKITVLILLISVVGIAAFLLSAQSTEQNSHTSFFYQFVVAGGPLVWFLLLPLSIITIYLGFDFTMTIRRAVLCPANISNLLGQIANNQSNQQWMVEISKNKDLVSQAVVKILAQKSLNTVALETILFDAVEIQALKLQRRIEWVNIISNVAPMMGLFGTVFGMIKAFNGIVIAGGQPQPAQLAEGISLALITTFWGLLVAIPAISIYGFFSNRLESIAAAAISEAELLVPALKQITKQERSFVRNRLNQSSSQ